MKAEIELPPLPDGWADGPVEIGYGVAPLGSMILTCFGWDKSIGSDVSFVYAVKKWVPAIVTAGVLDPGWIGIDEDGTYWFGDRKPVWDDDAREWASHQMERLRLRETPQVTGKTAIWEIK